MPLFEFLCEDCHTETELLVRLGEQPACPACASTRLEKLLSVPAPARNGGLNVVPTGCAPAGPVCSPTCCRLPQ